MMMQCFTCGRWFENHHCCPSLPSPFWPFMPQMVYASPAPTGWKCPVCGVGVAPTELVCPNCKPVADATAKPQTGESK